MEKLCKNPNCEYCRKIREKVTTSRYSLSKTCPDCGKLHMHGERCNKCSRKLSAKKYAQKLRKYPSPPICIDCGKPHTHGLRCQKCSQKHGVEEFMKNNPEYRERRDFRIKMRYKRDMWICYHCGKPFQSHVSSVKKTHLKCPFCGVLGTCDMFERKEMSRSEVRTIMDGDTLEGASKLQEAVQEETIRKRAASFSISEDTLAKFRTYCRENQACMSVIVEVQIINYLEEEENAEKLHGVADAGLEDGKDADSDKKPAEQGEVHGDSNKTPIRDRDSREATDAG
jgi:hypothetical protein